MQLHCAAVSSKMNLHLFKCRSAEKNWEELRPLKLCLLCGPTELLEETLRSTELPAQRKTPGDCNAKRQQGHISQWEVLDAEVIVYSLTALRDKSTFSFKLKVTVKLPLVTLKKIPTIDFFPTVLIHFTADWI